MTVEIDPEHPEWFTCAWIALPVRAAAFPLLMGQTRTPACLIDGTAYQLSKKSGNQAARWEALERSMHAEKEQLKEKLAAGLAAGSPEAALVETLEQWSGAQARRIVEALQQPE